MSWNEQEHVYESDDGGVLDEEQVRRCAADMALGIEYCTYYIFLSFAHHH